MKKPELSDNTIKEVQAFFYNRLENASKSFFCLSINDVERELFKACGFVFVSDSGSVIHSRTDCANGYNRPIPLSLAYKKGYRKVCTKCGPGSYLEDLLDAFENTQ